MRQISIAILVFPLLLITTWRCSQSPTVNEKNLIQNNPLPTNEKDYLELGYDLMKSESLDFLKLDIDLGQVENRLGRPSEEGIPELWGADGLIHKKIKFTPGIELDLIQQEDSSYSISSIKIYSPCTYVTQKNIGIDSESIKVLEAYKDYIDPDKVNNKLIIAGSEYGGILFEIENDKVKTIFIGAAAE